MPTEAESCYERVDTAPVENLTKVLSLLLATVIFCWNTSRAGNMDKEENHLGFLYYMVPDTQNVHRAQSLPAWISCITTEI